jgi:hypothetical protein
MDHPITPPLFPGQRDRLVELRMAANCTSPILSSSSSSAPFIPEFMDNIEMVKPLLHLSRSNNAALKHLYGKFFTSVNTKAREQVAGQMVVLIERNDLDLARACRICDELERSNLIAQKNPKMEPLTVAIRQNITIVVRKSFIDTAVEFQEIQTAYRTKYRQTARHLYQTTNASASDSDLAKAEDMDLSAVLIQAVGSVRRQQASDALSYVQSRHREILKIEKSLLELQRLFNDMAVLVAAQADFVDRIQGNIMVAKTSVKAGLTELRKARQFQNHKFKLSPVHLAKLMK